MSPSNLPLVEGPPKTAPEQSPVLRQLQPGSCGERGSGSDPPDLGPGECVSTPSALVGSAAPLLLGIRLPLGVPRALMGVILNVQATRSRPQIHGGGGRAILRLTLKYKGRRSSHRGISLRRPQN